MYRGRVFAGGGPARAQQDQGIIGASRVRPRYQDDHDGDVDPRGRCMGVAQV